MNDTPPEIERRYREMLLQRSGEERLRMGCSMFTFTRELVVASVLAKTPNVSPSELRRAIFLRFYGDDFDPETREKVLRVLESAGASTSPCL
jgi:hypothetical protein